MMEKCFLSKGTAKIHSQLLEMFKLIFSFQTAFAMKEEGQILSEEEFKQIQEIDTKFNKYISI